MTTSSHPNHIAMYRDQTAKDRHPDIQTFTIKCASCGDYRPKRGAKLVDGKRVCARCCSED